MKPSAFHTNKREHNWLVYKGIDDFLTRSAGCFAGVVYDFGCGEGAYREFLSGNATRYVGVDWGESSHTTCEDINADLNKLLPIESEVADTVVGLSVMEHLSVPQVMLNEAFRILKSGGWLVLYVPWQWSVHEAPHDYFRYTPHGLKYMLQKSGFANIEVEASSGFFTMLVIKINYFTRRYSEGSGLKRIARAIFVPFWHLGQWVAPLLDRMDLNWPMETMGYYVTAKKP